VCAAREQQHVLEELYERSGYLLHVVLRSLHIFSAINARTWCSGVAFNAHGPVERHVGTHFGRD